MTRLRTVLLAVAAVVVALAGILVVVVRGGDDPAPAGGVASDRRVTIPGSGGVSLAAEVITPKNVRKPPLIVMPASWGQPQTQYRAIARNLATMGYLVVAYTQRGFEDSTGTIDLAGAGTQADAGKVIDWALAETSADADHIGMFGMSYGAGVSLLTAAHDPRIKAVAALSTWTDVGASFDPDNTSSTRALATLLDSSGGGRPGSEVKRIQRLLKKDPSAVGAAMRTLSPTRSPMTYVDDLNRNKPAILLANAYEDSLFGPQQLVDFYDRLTTPKRLQLAPGDHGGPEASGLTGARNQTVEDVVAWFEHYLRGVDNGVQNEDPIILTDARTGAIHTLRAWPRGRTADNTALGVPSSKKQTGSGAAATWRSTIAAGYDSVATSGPAVAPFGTYSPPSAKLLAVQKVLAFVWTGAAVDEPTTVAGTPVVKVNLASTKRAATVVAYLYDIDSQGTGRLMSVQPVTLTGLRPGVARPVTIAMQPIAWTLPSGDRTIVVIDTVDPRYSGAAQVGARVTASSTTAHPASFSVPVITG